ncbi:arsenate reductase ArsC [Alteromonas lipotrueiana]|uniref:arsenate reductase ArsC n=1 Tax=Alteromonas lipotrueiana TaxID=2803815 RepID=UPI001C481305|nr:arsenate reductase ArsC [Alteromonas lipotrueiana]|tara:strand:+ start:452 stop:922 length:471 start_codon:yes stop_codon:yes gene_type:complete
MKILFVCTHNRCRSILSEAIFNQLGNNNIDAKSAGSHPAGEVHPATLQHLQQAGYPTEGLKSESWNDFEDFAPDVVITVCDSAAGEACPVYFGKTLKVHWGLADPSKIQDSEEAQARAFEAIIREIEERAKALNRFATINLEGDALRVVLNRLGAN